MAEILTNEQIANIFKEIDTNNDGFITRQDLEATNYAISLFESTPSAFNGFGSFHDGKMNLKDFTLLVHGSRYQLQDLAIAKFQAQKYLNKYLSVSAPGEAAPSVKQSYLRLAAHVNSEEAKLHSLGLQFGVDKPHQQIKIKELSQGKEVDIQYWDIPHIKSVKNGAEIASKLQELAQGLLQILKGLAPEMEQAVDNLKVYAKYANNYVYLVIEVDNPFLDGLISFAAQVVQSISPECAFKFKAKISSNLKDLLTQTFDYTKSGGEALFQLDIDHVTMKKLKQILGDNVNSEQESTPPNQLFSLLLEQVKVSAQFNNLGEALASTFKVDVNELPKLHDQKEEIKQLGIKETVGQFHQAGPGLLSLIGESSEAEGEISINFHDFFLKLSYDINIKNAFELLG